MRGAAEQEYEEKEDGKEEWEEKKKEIKETSEAKKVAAERVLYAAEGEKNEEKEKEKQQEELGKEQIMKSHCRMNTHMRQRRKQILHQTSRAGLQKKIYERAQRRSYGSARGLHVLNLHIG